MNKIVTALLGLAFMSNLAVFAADAPSATSSAPAASNSTETSSAAAPKTAKHSHKRHVKKQSCSKSSKK